MKILLDMNLSHLWIEILEHHVAEIVHWSHVGSKTETDPAIVDFARREGYVILTQDLDFGAILSASGQHRPSVLLLRAGRVTPVTLGLQVIAALERLENDLAEGAFVTIEPRRTRVSSLPLGKRNS